MRLSDLQLLLKFEITIESFVDTIKNEVDIYERCLAKKGASCDVIVTNDIDELLFSEANLQYLLTLKNQALITDYQLSYIVDVLALIENIKFDDDDMLDQLEEYSK